ncbi:MAG: HlyD family efflux transporter periplasmic adaptor subunit [Rhodocyclaceae bacterium]|nr:HlyD family efflux transporter periplasmic adaptor subunit [Rhodocyclaceae bacterium]
MQLRARIGITLLAVAIAGGLALGFFPRAVGVETVAAVKGPLEVTVEEEGKTRVRDRYVISAPVTGHVRRIDLRVGDALSAGQTVAVIEPVRSSALDPRTQAQAAAALQAAEAALAVARANVRAAAAQAELARHELERAESLRNANFVSAQAIDRARAELDRSQAAKLAAEHGVTAAQFERERARAALVGVSQLQRRQTSDALVVRTPVAAAVLKLVHESEGTVQAGSPLLEVGNPEALEVAVEVLSSQAVRIAPGAKVLFDRWGGEKTLQGVVRVVEPPGFTKVSALGVEEQRVRVIADFSSPRAEWQRIGDGYRVEARFVVWEDADVLQIPTNALFRHDNGWAAFVVEAGRARLRPLRTGQRNGLQVQVLAGLQAGERVIVHPDDKINDGIRVKPR